MELLAYDRFARKGDARCTSLAGMFDSTVLAMQACTSLFVFFTVLMFFFTSAGRRRAAAER